MSKLLKLILIVVGAGLALFIIIQLVPYGRDHTNPPVVKEPDWPNPETRALAARACFDCHSNETAWPWYTKIAPVSWLTYRDVMEGREHLNFSEWGQGHHEVDEIGEVVAEGEMPPPYYLPLHPPARLTQAEAETLVQGLSQLAGGK